MLWVSKERTTVRWHFSFDPHICNESRKRALSVNKTLFFAFTKLFFFIIFWESGWNIDQKRIRKCNEPVEVFRGLFSIEIACFEKIFFV